MPKANSPIINPIAIYPTKGIIIFFLLLYYMKCSARIQPDRAKCYGKCLLSIARKPNQNLEIAPKSTYQSKNKTENKLKINGYCSKNNLDITHIHLKIAHIHLKIDAFSILYIERRINLKIGLKIKPDIVLKIKRGGGDSI